MQLDAAATPVARSERSAAHSAAVAVKGSYFSADLTEKDSRPRKARTLLSLCINQIGESFAHGLCCEVEPARVSFPFGLCMSTTGYRSA